MSSTTGQPGKPNDACPSQDMLLDWSLGQLPADEIERIGAHVENCPTCQKVLESLDRIGDSVVADLRSNAGTPPAQPDPALVRQIEQAEGISQMAWSASPARANDAPPPRNLGQYEVLEPIGEGGMGRVYKGRHLRLNRLVAIKLLPDDRVRDPEAVARFHREMEAVGRLDHPNLVRASDAGESSGRHYLVMEYLTGSDLGRLVKRDGPLPPADAAEVIRQAALGLQHAHEHGLVHRDVKPTNLMLTDEGVVKVLDLGLARLAVADADDPVVTATQQIVGTGDFVAPEQGQDARTADARSDIYALGCTLYYLLAGQPPFGDEKSSSFVKKVMAHSQKPVPPISRFRMDVPAGLLATLDAMLAKDPANRPQSAGELACTIQPFAAGCNLRALVSGSAHATSAAPVKKPGRRPLVIAGAVAGVVSVLAAAAYFSWPEHRIPTTPIATTQPAKTVPPPVPPTPLPPATIPVQPPVQVVPATIPVLAQGLTVPATKPVPQPLASEIVNSVGMKLRLIPAGEFVMGSPETEAERDAAEGPQHRVRITRPFYMGAFEVTQAQYRTVMGDNPSYYSPTGGARDEVIGQNTNAFPVDSVNWEDAVAFCRKLSDLPEEQKAGRRYRLPTEAEWEYSCRAGSTDPFTWGKSATSTQANFKGEFPYGGAPKGPSIRGPVMVGQYKPNAWGLYDMHGNVWEWCNDWLDADYYRVSPVDDPPGPATGPRHVFRGGSWGVGGNSCRSAHRSAKIDTHWFFFSLGFRIAADAATVAVPAAKEAPP